ncbi:MAG TPA: gamma-butyrobetaine hydroxylase-like domain-containing protein [Burkholderiales bacterium]
MPALGFSRSRLDSPSEAKQKIQTGAMALPLHVEIIDVRPIRTYALQFVFSDGHERGVFPFRYLRELKV